VSRTTARRDLRWPPVAVGGLATAFAATFITLSLLRHRGFFTARYDLGNMTQAVWSASRGELFTVTDPSGAQMSRLGAHVEPILGLFAPLWRIWPSPEVLLVVQAVAAASAAIPAYLLARRWLGDERLAVAFAAVTMLFPAIEWATVFDFHPVTLAAPLLMWSIWAAVDGRYVTLAATAMLAAFTKEQVGLALVVLGIWMAVSLGRRRAGAILAVMSLAWSAFAVWVIIPHYNGGEASAFVGDRYGDLGSGAGDVLRTVVLHPWEAIQLGATADGGKYVLALILPLLALCLFAPLLAAGAVPDLLLNLLSSRPEQHHIEYHYSAVIAPFLIAAAIRGLATLRRRGHPGWMARLLASPGRVAIGLVAAGVVGGFLLGPLPFWSHVPGGSKVRAEQYRVSPRAALWREAVALVPEGAVVSAGNRIAGHLSDRRKILAFPTIADAEYVVIDLQRPDVDDDVDPVAHAAAVARLRARSDFRIVSDDDGVLVFRRVSPA
jgi:uncharacterized membrane protein